MGQHHRHPANGGTVIDCIPGPERRKSDGRCICINCGSAFACHGRRNCRPRVLREKRVNAEQQVPSEADKATREAAEAALTEAAEKLGVSLDDVKHYAGAVWRWAKAGYPKRTTEEIELIYETHCKPCGDNINGRCKHCGCSVSKSKFTLLNKIKMGTESCPLKKW